VPFVYVGGGNNLISVYRLNPSTGALTFQSSADGGNNPSFLAVDPAAQRLYAVAEGTAGRVVAYSINQTTGALTPLNSAAAGNGPAHLSVDATGRFVLVANYGGGTVAVLPVTGAGVGAAVSTQSPGPMAHQIITDATNRFAVVPTLGADAVFQYAFDPDGGALTPNPVASVATANNAGPRHIAFHPNGRFAYLINETDDTLTAMAWNATTGRLTPLQTLSTLPNGVAGNTNTCAEVVVSPSGNFVYGSNRGHNSIVTFALDADAGTMTLVGHTPTGGSTPRNFTVDPSGTLMLVANQGSSNVVAFRVDGGSLSSLGVVATPNSPAYVGVVYLPGP
jgi:6-phosphogluconolactonase